ncbi:hypothetical protein [Streptomyces sp. NPDC058268]|uniref:hypothetical protein n=1 Tax=Streptomyces sp. NPDC058268 TaxID=3346413 RepID=UPI0036EECB34
MNRFPTRAMAAAATVLLAVGCSSTSDDKNTQPKDKTKDSPPAAAAGLEIRPGKDLVVHQGSVIEALDAESLQIRKQITVPDPVAKGQLAGTGHHSRAFDTSFRYALVGEGAMTANDAKGALKVADLTAAGTGKAVLAIGREQLNAAGATGTISGAQFTQSAKGPELWFQTTPADSPSGETWSSSTASQYKITSLWSVNIKDWQAGKHTATKHPVPQEVQAYWQTQECQTAFSRGPLQDSFTPWSCWFVDGADTPIASDRSVKGNADTGWRNPAGSSSATQKVTFNYLKSSGGKPGSPVSVGGAGGNGASTLDGMSGVIDSGSAASERKMWRFTTAGTELKLTALPDALAPSTSAKTELWALPGGRAVAKVEEGDAATGWILTADGAWKKVGPWLADLEDADIEPTA